MGGWGGPMSHKDIVGGCPGGPDQAEGETKQSKMRRNESETKLPSKIKKRQPACEQPSNQQINKPNKLIINYKIWSGVGSGNSRLLCNIGFCIFRTAARF